MLKIEVGVSMDNDELKEAIMKLLSAYEIPELKSFTEALLKLATGVCPIEDMLYLKNIFPNKAQEVYDTLEDAELLARLKPVKDGVPEAMSSEHMIMDGPTKRILEIFGMTKKENN